jgi:glutathione synthase/RimK-type ligase-like ATP-grasp enzyme
VVDCIVATCAGIPRLDPDDRLLLNALRARGLTAEAAVWSDPSVDWSAARLCLLRSTWDYPKHYDRFFEWLEALERVTTIRNALQLVRWNSHKGYLLDLARAGIPIIQTAWVSRGERVDLLTLLAERGWSEAVVKPARGSAALDVLRVSLEESARGQAHLARLLREQDVLVQPYMRAVESYPERSLVFIGGAFSHAVSKRPFDTKLAIGDASARLVTPTAAERAVAARAMESLPGDAPLYGRVDIFRAGDGELVVNEVELIEPALYLGAYLPAAGAFADAIALDLGA